MRAENFNRGEDSSPRSGTTTDRRVYVSFDTNTSGGNVNPCAFFEFDSYDSANKIYSVKTPTGSADPALLLISSGHLVATDDKFLAKFIDHTEVYSLYIDTTDGTPVAGDEVGPVADSHYGSVSGEGFLVLSYSATLSLAQVRMMGAAGEPGVDNNKLVQAQSTGGSGSVSVKDVVMNSNLATSPNFTTPGSAYSVAYIIR